MFLSLEVIIQIWEVIPRISGLMEDKAEEIGMEASVFSAYPHHYSGYKIIW